jgi:hypothetical protein
VVTGIPVGITVEKLTLTATAEATARDYDGTTAVVVSITPTNLVGGDAVGSNAVILTATGTADSADVGIGKTVTISNISEPAGEAAVNYNKPVSIPDTTVTITPASLSAASISGLAAPATGVTSSTATGGITAGTGYTVQSLAWKQGGSAFTGTFAPLASYTAEIVLQAGTNYTFGSAFKPTVNTGTVAADGIITGSGSGNTLTFTVSFPETTGGTATVITAWVAGETIATDASASPIEIHRTAGMDASGNHLVINVTNPVTGDSYAWTVNGEPLLPAQTTATFTFDATWRSNGAYAIGLAVTRGGTTYSTIITVTVQD